MGVVERAPRIKFCGITRAEDAELAVALGRVGDRAEPVAVVEAVRRPGRGGGDRAAAAAQGRAGGRVRQPVAGRDRRAGRRDRAVDRAAARRRGAGVRQRGRAADGREGHQGAVGAAGVRRRSRSRRSTPTSTCWTRTATGSAAGRGRRSTGRCSSRRRSQMPLILSGGLTPENVADAIAAVEPWGVDVASGIERAPGVKDPEKMKAFAAAVRSTRTGRADADADAARSRRAGEADGMSGIGADRPGGPLRALRRAVRARDADARAGRAGAHVGARRGATRRSGPS